MGLFDFFKTKKYGGFVAAYKLEKFWDHLLEEERAYTKECLSKLKSGDESFKTGNMDDPKIKIKKVEESVDQFLFALGTKISTLKNYTLAEKLLTHAAMLSKNPTIKHQILNELIDLYYKQREDRLDAIEKCKIYCQQDIELYPSLKEKSEITYDSVESFKRLAIIFEREEKYKEAIKVSELAILYGLKDGTKGGYEGRIDKLMKKLS